MSETILCGCGCGMRVTVVRGKARLFVTGHNSKVLKIRKPRVTFICNHCGITVEKRPSEGRNRKYCSKECRNAHRKSLAGSKHPWYRRTHTTCKMCGNNFEVTPARLRRGNLVYCSMECSRAGQAQTMREKPRKVGLVGKTQAKRRDQFRCRLCGFDLAVHGHHIIPRREGGSNATNNIITLCPNHHASVHAGLISREELTEALLTALPEGEMLYQPKYVIRYRTGG